jgi:hypothetical protein
MGDISLVAFPRDVDVIDTTWQPASSLVLTVPGVLMDYYDQRISVQLVGELLNAMVDTGGNPIGGKLFAQLSQPAAKFKRVTSPLVEISDYFRSGQTQCLVLIARMIVQSYGFIARNLTAVLYFGSVTIGRQG